MSLDVNLVRKRWISYDEGKTFTEDSESVYDANITHNLGKMAKKANIYDALWRPHRLKSNYIKTDDYDKEMDFESSVTVRASEIIESLEIGLSDLESRPEYFKQFNNPNGWGMYEHFLPFVAKYLDACIKNPSAIVIICR